MSNPNHHHEGECCGCGRMAPIDATELCVTCTENLNALIDEREELDGGPTIRLASGNANPDEEPEFLEAPSRDCDCGFDGDRSCPNCSTMDDMACDADNDSFADACGQMTREDWDADNDWLASAGWGEM
jgi:hypothetical protein